ncbi:ABC transporter ATP-binding protein/permease [Maridesulfovibrio sp.]|uniref:ABC transporter ATP-binding protein/permease n=1 Tax=Maridesulfovibrio sp. TaxID=2795000 RepID=UPI002A18DBDC|nr:ABC transporter ATP-binding protein/permease [Maridesulfovibrio sp.]
MAYQSEQLNRNGNKMQKQISFFKGFYKLISPYWRSEEKWKAWGLLAVIVTMNLGIVYINVRLNSWYRSFYNALEAKDVDAFFKYIIEFSILAGIFILLAVYALYLNQMLQIKWRKWVTDNYLSRWLREKNYYRLTLLSPETDNPDQRISEDINMLVELTLSLGLGIMRAVVTLVSFVIILWGISGPLDFSFNGFGFHIPGYMVWAALLYSILGTWLTMKVGGPLTRLNFDQQRLEADFRFSLVRLRENSESIAVYGGEKQEGGHFLHRFKLVVENYWKIMRRQKKLTWLTSSYNQAAVIFPILVAAPRYFAGVIQLGGLMQIASAFGQVHDALSYIVNSYVGIAEWIAVVRRLTGFTEQMEMVERHKNEEKIRIGSTDSDFRVSSLEVSLPDGRTLLSDLNLELTRGKRLIITGPSGCGKSTLLRTLAGIWPFGQGEIDMPARDKVMFLSQKPYLPLGTLRQAMYYPGSPEEGDTRIEELMKFSNLEHLTGELDTYGNWGQVLSLGEQQRVAFVRILLNKPEYLFMDEATASLDEELENRMYSRIFKECPDMAVISIGHRSTLLELHDLRLKLTGKAEWELVPA